MKRHLRPFTSLLCTTIILGGCMPASDNSARYDALKDKAILNKQTFTPADNVSTAYSATDINARVAEAAKNAKGLTLPARFGLVRIKNAKISQIPSDELTLWNETAKDDAIIVGHYSPVHLIDASALHPNGGKHYASKLQQIFGRARIAGAQQHLDAILVYELVSETDTQENILALADATIVGSYASFGRAIKGKSIATGVLIDVKTGTVFRNLQVLADSTIPSSRVNHQLRTYDAIETAEKNAVIKLGEDLHNTLSKLLPKKPATTSTSPAEEVEETITEEIISDEMDEATETSENTGHQHVRYVNNPHVPQQQTYTRNTSYQLAKTINPFTNNSFYASDKLDVLMKKIDLAQFEPKKEIIAVEKITINTAERIEVALATQNAGNITHNPDIADHFNKPLVPTIEATQHNVIVENEAPSHQEESAVLEHASENETTNTDIVLTDVVEPDVKNKEYAELSQPEPTATLTDESKHIDESSSNDAAFMARFFDAPATEEEILQALRDPASVPEVEIIETEKKPVQVKIGKVSPASDAKNKEHIYSTSPLSTSPNDEESHVAPESDIIPAAGKENPAITEQEALPTAE